MPHSILKKSKPPPATGIAPSAPRSQEERHREVALYHAQIIQQRKDMEARILASIETLLDLPTSPSADPAHPSHSDATLVKSSLNPFQPSDYDVLVEERNINELCGYVLCPRRNKKQNTEAKYRILQGSGKGADALKVVSRQSLERWCSDDCGKRALFIKVQLNEEPPWTRADPNSGEITLLENERQGEKHSESETSLVQGILNLDVGNAEDQIAESMKALALERGDAGAHRVSHGLGDFTIRENAVADGKPLLPSFVMKGSGQHDFIEGYKPRLLDRNVEKEKTVTEEDDIMRTF